jgi:GNAT superfamily N-acetyltransferase
MTPDPIAVFIGAVHGMQARIAQSGDRALLRQIVGADAAQMLVHVPLSARGVLVSAQVEGRLNTARRSHPDAVTLLVGEDMRATGLLVVDWPAVGPVTLLEFLFLPHLRGQGRGTRLLSALTAVADTQRQPVRAILFYDSPARRLLSRAGFIKARDDGTEILMERAVGAAIAVPEATVV